ncbi:MAG: cation transporter, partial [Candidatus Latescibacterota bacterium]
MKTDKSTVSIEGMSCAACVARVEKALRDTPGVVNASVNLATSAAYVEYNPSAAEVSDIVGAVKAAGYTARSQDASGGQAGEEAQQDGSDAFSHLQEYAKLKRKWIVSAVLSIPVLIFGFHGLLPYLSGLTPQTMQVVWMLSGAAMLFVMFWSGGHFFTGAAAAFRHRSADMNTLIAMGTSAAWIYSTIAVLGPGLFPSGTAEPFYDVVGVLITLVVLGKSLEIRARGKTSQAIRQLIELQPKTAAVLRDGKELDVPIGDVTVGDIVLVRPGERIPVDGFVVDG